jgi:hypothetical protein
MSTKLSLLSTAMCVLLVACTKDQTKDKTASSLLSEAQRYFSTTVAGETPLAANYRAAQPRTVLWDSAIVQHFTDGDEVILPVVYRHHLYVSSQSAPGRIYRLNDLTSLVISRDSTGHFASAVVTFIPDSANSPKAPHGTWFVEDWQGNSLYGPVHAGPPANRQQATIATTSSKEVDYIQSIQVCNEIDGYNYSPDDPDGGIAWSETTCTTYGLPAEDPAAGIPPSRLAALRPTRMLSPLEIVVNPPASPISSIADYFKCFTNGTSPGQTYSVQVCVDQPDPGTRQPWTFTSGGAQGTSAAGNPFNVGHTFLVLTENNQGNIISRNVGFYPADGVLPLSGYTSAQGVLGDDDEHEYNVSLTINVSASQFFGILNYVSLGNNNGYTYDLNTNNCTTFVVNALGANGIVLPTTQGTWGVGGKGDDPGDLGQDISQMPLTSNMTRNTVSNPHPNVGTCN